jgi:hypothetical protein
MTFHFTLKENESILKFAAKAGENVAIIDLGYDDDGTSYKILVALVVVTAMPESHRDLYFSIVESKGDMPAKHLKRGIDTKPFLTGEHREKVLSAIALITVHLAKLVNCEVLTINTIETDLPYKALKKFDQICEYMTTDGYKGKRTNSFHGAEQWLIKKIDNQ